jgi:hypothetical protein
VKKKIGRTDRGLSLKERKHLEFYVLMVEKERSEPLSDADVDRILGEMQSGNPEIRAKAVRQVCPCRVNWDVFNRLRKSVKAMQRDRDASVAACARHVEQDARQVAQSEARLERMAERKDYEDKHRRLNLLATELRRTQRRTKSYERCSFESL